MWSDTESDKDYLNFGEVSQLAVDILTADGMLPVSVGVFGNWGAGKSSLLKLIEEKLEDLRQRVLARREAEWEKLSDETKAAHAEYERLRERDLSAQGNWQAPERRATSEPQGRPPARSDAIFRSRERG